MKRQLNQLSSQRSLFSFPGVARTLPALALCVGAGSILMLSPTRVEALEELTLTYGEMPLQTIPVRDLEQFAVTGEPSTEIRSLLDAAGIDTATAQSVLVKELEVDGELLSRVAQTFVGEAVLQQAGTAISRPGSSTESWQDLRRALLTAIEDDRLSTLEVLQNFEGASLTVDTQQVGRVAGNVQRSVRDIQSLVELLRSRQNQPAR
ncbi:alpha/beta hydrolase [Pseudanabaena sp. FACHB-2040]|uniref:alpha/beta hydrolase n=1 Tax=Pseudanabaena sp. FACHB-2040 TaxID=2692859 RepID=UPI001685BF65|nr:alpha/beta hydrolase [Pseudanabaena sp. FACHB-2040]MBD2261006.1 alpha/beta hydrolase [Pseudanabaena sp. FACHB-2040]